MRTQGENRILHFQRNENQAKLISDVALGGFKAQSPWTT